MLDNDDRWREERCKCGHDREEHKDLKIGIEVLDKGHGACSQCACHHFAWTPRTAKAVA